MKITKIAIETVAGGTLVTLGMLFAVNEELQEADIAKAFDIASEAAGADKVSRDTGSNPLGTPEMDKALAADQAKLNALTETAAANPTDPSPETETDASPRRRRRASAASEASNSAASSAGETQGAVQDDAAPLPRRRRGSSPAAESTTSSPSAPSASPSGSEAEPRRRRRSEAAPSAATVPTATSEAEPRRRRASTASTTAETAPSHSEITDADLSRAASEGARHLTPKVVLELLSSYGVKSTGELKGGKRAEFLAAVKAAIASAK